MNANTASKTKTTLTHTHTHTNRDIVPPDGKKNKRVQNIKKGGHPLLSMGGGGKRGVVFLFKFCTTRCVVVYLPCVTLCLCLFCFGAKLIIATPLRSHHDTVMFQPVILFGVLPCFFLLPFMPPQMETHQRLSLAKRQQVVSVSVPTDCFSGKLMSLPY